MCGGQAVKGFVALGGVVRWPGPEVTFLKAGKSNQLAAPHDGRKALCVGKTDCLGDVGRYFL